LNAAAFPPDDIQNLVMIGEVCCEMVHQPIQETAEMLVTRAARLVNIAEALPQSEGALTERMLIIAGGYLLRVHSNGEGTTPGFEAVLLRIRNLAFLIDLDRLSCDLHDFLVE